MKYCPDCDTSKNEVDYYKNKTRFDNLSVHCKICTKKRVNDYHVAIRNGVKAMGRDMIVRSKAPNMPEKRCAGCDSTHRPLFVHPGDIVALNEAWWHVPCYNAATLEEKKEAKRNTEQHWAEIQVQWESRPGRHCNGGLGGNQYRRKLKQKLLPEDYERRLIKLERNRKSAIVRRSKGGL